MLYAIIHFNTFGKDSYDVVNCNTVKFNQHDDISYIVRNYFEEGFHIQKEGKDGNQNIYSKLYNFEYRVLYMRK
uniref:Uncharacterized protein n=1 Tax=viral metagenome TaxID=1070528 RepID=A0A6C0EAN8_9ZZZZ